MFYSGSKSRRYFLNMKNKTLKRALIFINRRNWLAIHKKGWITNLAFSGYFQTVKRTPLSLTCSLSLSLSLSLSVSLSLFFSQLRLNRRMLRGAEKRESKRESREQSGTLRHVLFWCLSNLNVVIESVMITCRGWSLRQRMSSSLLHTWAYSTRGSWIFLATDTACLRRGG